jgi:acyl-CoA carboxylase epsilon subunit
MNHDAEITEVSDPRDMTIDDPSPPIPEIQILKGNPTDDEIASLAAVLAATVGGSHAPGPQELNPWGHPIDKLRYSIFSWQRVTLLERSHMRR